MHRPRRLAPTLVAACLLIPLAATAAFEEHFDPDGAGPLYRDVADGRLTPRPALEALELAPGERIEVDGRLDDPAWARAPAGYGMLQHEPERGGTASVQSVFKIAYDEDALYLAAACYEDDMAQVARRLSRRDNIESSDFISFYIDPYHDRLSGYNFRVSADGVKADHYLFDDTSRDPDWNAVWDAETWEDDRGWYVELRIPFQAVRFRPAADMTWGLQFYRWLHGRGEDTGWATWDRNDSGFVSRWGTLTGLRGVRNPRGLEVLPYLAGGLVDRADGDDADESFGRYFNLGADLKYNLTSALTAQATFQPDFGQVEADPALLNLSPFETFYQEKRPFFVEGARFFEHPHFNLFYSRRIGTGDPNSRIRAAAKVTGKIDGATSLAFLGALTDIAPAGRVHNPFVGGHDETGYAVVRVARDLDGGNHRLGMMGTAVWRQDRDLPGPAAGDHDAYSGGLDWEFNFADKTYRIDGSVVGTMLDPQHEQAVGDTVVRRGGVDGTAGNLRLRKQSGSWRAQLHGSWESDRFDPNDIGFLSANDEITSSAYLQYRYDAEGRRSLLKSFYPFVQVWKNWLYGDQTRTSETTGETVWSYDRWHRQNSGAYAEIHAQTHSFWNLGLNGEHGLEGTSRYLTRDFDGRRGPLMTTAPYTSLEASLETDWRRDLIHSGEVEYQWNDVGSRLWELSYGLRVNAGRHFVGRVNLNFQDRDEDAQWVDNYGGTGVGIDGVAYVFGRLEQQTLDATVRASWLFTRDSSLELYLQPYLTRGAYSDARYLATPDSRDLRAFDAYPAGGRRDISDHDFDFGALNVNLVWRWEYRPGSTVYLVWTHGRTTYDERQSYGNPGDFTGRLNPGLLFDQEPENTFLAKVSYWFSI